jgi:hypothetical protein
MKLLAALAAVAVTAVPLIHAPAPASAAASSIRVDNPNGDEYESGQDVLVDGWNSSDYSESISVECYHSSTGRSATVAPGTFSVSVGSFTGPDTCRIYDDYYEQLAMFRVAAPPTKVSGASVSATSFYPRVRDGYRDTVTFRWSQSHRAPATVRVLNSHGTAVRVATLGSATRSNAWRWNGLNGAGSPVGTGRYRISVTANTNTVSAPVTVASGTVARSFAIRKEGNQASSMATRGDCFARRDSYYQVATLDCWGGRLAQATYRIALPRGAFDVRGAIDLLHSDLDYCCRGRITKGWDRPSALVVSLWAKVTGWRATDVNFVRVTYKRHVRI